MIIINLIYVTDASLKRSVKINFRRLSHTHHLWRESDIIKWFNINKLLNHRDDAHRCDTLREMKNFSTTFFLLLSSANFIIIWN